MSLPETRAPDRVGDLPPAGGMGRAGDTRRPGRTNMNYRLTIAAAVGTLLASTALYALFVGLQWFWAGLGAVAVAAAVGLLTRRWPSPVLPSVGAVTAALAGLLLYLNVLFAPHQSWFLVVPNATSLGHVWQVATEGMSDADRFSPPVPLTPGLLLLAVAGIGVAAIAADLLAARLRRSALAGLALLALFIVPSTTPAVRSGFGTALVFCLGTIGYLVILAADGRDRIGRWGRTVGLWRTDRYGQPVTGRRGPGAVKPADVNTLASAGRRIGLISIVLALFVPLFIPGLRVNRMFPAHVNVFGPAGNGLGTGGSTSVPDPLAQMTQDLREGDSESVLTYTTSDPEPQYLQMYVLGNLSTTRWTLSPHLGSNAPAAGTLPKAQGLTSATKPTVTTQTTHVTFSSTASGDAAVSFLPVPYPPTKINVSGHWVINDSTGMVFGFNNPLSGLSYTVTSQDVEPTAGELARTGTPPAAITSQFLPVPAPFKSLTALARKVTKSATTPYARALALQNWFTESGGFSYSLNVNEPADAAGLTNFLTVSKRGYCQQFAFAMAVLARLLGIPSRVAVGFTPGTATGQADTYQVRTSDAHAWPELYFEGLGWLRFEPTPSGSGGQGTAVPPTYTVPQISSNGTGSAAAGTSTPAGSGSSSTAKPGVGANKKLADGDLGGGGGGAAKGGSGFPFEPIGLALLALLGVVVIAPPASRFLVRQRRLAYTGDLARAHAAWRETLDELADYHVARRPSESPRAVALRVTDESHLATPAAQALGRVALAEERASYADSPGTAPTRADLELIRHGLAANATRRARWRARLTPASAYVPLRNLTVALSGAAAQVQSKVGRHLPGGRRSGRSHWNGYSGFDDAS
jgi:transglutaminase-like putative cysteine protease